MKWNFRLVDMSHENGGDPWIVLCEVFYNDAGKPVVYSDPCTGSETVAGMQDLIGKYRDALKAPVLKPEDFKK